MGAGLEKPCETIPFTQSHMGVGRPKGLAACAEGPVNLWRYTGDVMARRRGLLPTPALTAPAILFNLGRIQCDMLMQADPKPFLFHSPSVGHAQVIPRIRVCDPAWPPTGLMRHLRGVGPARLLKE